MASNKFEKWRETNRRVLANLSSNDDMDYDDSLDHETGEADSTDENHLLDVVENIDSLNDSINSDSLSIVMDSDFSDNEDASISYSDGICHVTPFSIELASCATLNCWTRSSVIELLNILRGQGLGLPKDARTL